MSDVASKLREYADRFEAALPDFLPRAVYPVEQAMHYSMEAGGKRIRPALVLAFCELFGGDTEQAMPLAAAIEMVHCYSLIHDDLPCMDDDDFRRGKPSCHKQFGEATALLAGDALLTQAFWEADKVEGAVSILADLAGIHGMIGGQQLDLLYENKTISLNQLINMNQRKTGALFCAACRLGCLAAGVWNHDHDPERDVAEDYTGYLSVLFQLTDDILDVTGNSEALGKTIGKDEAAGKSTWVSILGLEQAQAQAQELAQSAREAIAPYAGPGHFLYDLPEWLITREH